MDCREKKRYLTKRQLLGKVEFGSWKLSSPKRQMHFKLHVEYETSFSLLSMTLLSYLSLPEGIAAEFLILNARYRHHGSFTKRLSLPWKTEFFKNILQVSFSWLLSMGVKHKHII